MANPMPIQLGHRNSQRIYIPDTFWQPERIGDIFLVYGFDVQFHPVHIHHAPIQDNLKEAIQQHNLSADMPEWTTPLYQIIQITR